MKNNNTVKIVVATQSIFILCFFVYLLFATTFMQIECNGCMLCGMTRAFRAAFKGDFLLAYQYNEYVFSTLTVFFVLGIDMCFSFIYLFLNKRNSK